MMTMMKTALTTATLLALGMLAAPAQAQLARTWVSSLGNDANDCNRSTPCKTFQRAHDNTLALGEISVLDPGGYGAVTITKGISIINEAWARPGRWCPAASTASRSMPAPTAKSACVA